jgi:putative SOS response-associated peptidase YedK
VRASEIVHYVIIQPNEFVSEVHDRMPAVLTEKQYGPWLSGAGGYGNPKAGAERLSPAMGSIEACQQLEG